jgi:enoyl-CoA hydratase/carnithine racemase
MSEHIRSSTEGGVLTLRLSRAEKKNALTRAMYGSLAATLRAAAEDPGVRVVLVAGGTDFTAGNDITDFTAAANGAPRVSAAFDFLEVLAEFPKPLVAAVRGVAIGVGTTLLLHCDVGLSWRMRLPRAHRESLPRPRQPLR